MDALPCVGCGWCCLQDQCEVSHRLHGYLPRCPELRWDQVRNRYHCALVAAVLQTPLKARTPRDIHLLRELFVGQGCCAPLNAWRGSVCQRERGAP